jgi:hypothetical protein
LPLAALPDRDGILVPHTDEAEVEHVRLILKRAEMIYE